MHEALDRHPWAAGLMTKPVGLRPGRVAFGESLLARLEQAGFPDDVSFHVYHVLDAWIVGYSLWLAGHPLTSGERAAVAERLETTSPSTTHRCSSSTTLSTPAPVRTRT
jgi:Tetracyclin repressor-like, C-terminal domain